MSAKKKSKEGGSARRKGGKRADISAAGSYRLFKAGAVMATGDAKTRVSKDAAEAAADRLEDFLGDLAKRIQEILDVSKRKTIDKKIVRLACQQLGEPRAVCGADSKKSTRAHRSAFSHAGILRRMKASGLSKGARTTPEAKRKLVGVAEAYMKHLGHSAGCVTTATTRSTVKGRDVAALSCL